MFVRVRLAWGEEEEFPENRAQEVGGSDLYVPALFRDAHCCSIKGTESISIIQ